MSDRWFGVDPGRMPLARLLCWTGQALGRHHQRAAAAHGLSWTALGVLGVLAHAGPDTAGPIPAGRIPPGPIPPGPTPAGPDPAGPGMSHRELAARLGLTPATLTPVVDGLDAAGELTRARDAADRRVVRLSITPAGRARLEVTFAAVLRQRVPQPPAAEQEIIRNYLLTVLTAAEGDT